MRVSQAEEMLREFSHRHHIQMGEHLVREVLPIQAVSLANMLITEGYASLSDELLENDLAVGLLLNMLHRNFSLVDGAILAFAAECGEVSEVSARASVEASLNISYILQGEPEERIRAYFDHYLASADKQVSTWRAGISTLDGPEAMAHARALARRTAANAALRTLVEQIGRPATERWPRSVEDRFKAVGDPLAYRTFYSRMSSEVHGDAEETLRHLVGTLAGEEQYKAMALETVWTSRFYVHYAASRFLSASIMYALHYGLTDQAQLLQAEFEVVSAEMALISKNIGAGEF